MPERKGTIYAIKMKSAERPVYVGQTRRSVKARWAEHILGKTPISLALRASDDLSEWEIIVVETVSVRELNDREAFWIAEFGTLHPNGLNRTTGGSTPMVSAAARRKQSSGLKLAFADPAFRKWRAEASIQVWRAHRGALVAGMNVAWSRPERRAKHSQSMKAAMADPDRRARIAAGVKAYRQKMREARLAGSSSD